MVHYRLVYFGVRGRAEGIRYILHYAGEDFDDAIIQPADWWPATKPKMPMGQVPVLQFDGEELCQSTAIGRFLARKFDLTGSDDYDAARCDMLVDGIQADMMPLFDPLVKARMAGDKQKEADLWATLKTELLPPILQRYETLINKNDGGFFVANKLTWADLWVGEMMERLSKHAELFTPYPGLIAHYKRIHQLPNIAKYVASGKQSEF